MSTSIRDAFDADLCSSALRSCNSRSFADAALISTSIFSTLPRLTASSRSRFNRRSAASAFRMLTSRSTPFPASRRNRAPCSSSTRSFACASAILTLMVAACFSEVVRFSSSSYCRSFACAAAVSTSILAARRE